MMRNVVMIEMLETSTYLSHNCILILLDVIARVEFLFDVSRMTNSTTPDTFVMQHNNADMRNARHCTRIRNMIIPHVRSKTVEIGILKCPASDRKLFHPMAQSPRTSITIAERTTS